MERQQIVEASDTSLTTIYRTRQQLVEEGLDAVLSPKKPLRTSVLPILTARGKLS
jgi:hypothetical protein